MGCIIMDDILGIQNIIVLMFVCCRRDKVVVNLIADNVWDYEYELTVALSEEVESWY